jgi:hypothetical protein
MYFSKKKNLMVGILRYLMRLRFAIIDRIRLSKSAIVPSLFNSWFENSLLKVCQVNLLYTYIEIFSPSSSSYQMHHLILLLFTFTLATKLKLNHEPISGTINTTDRVKITFISKKPFELIIYTSERINRIMYLVEDTYIVSLWKKKEHYEAK